MSRSDCTDLDHCECVNSLYERIKLLEKRVIDLQGHDNLSHIDSKLSEQEGVERLRAKKKQIYEDLKDAVESEWGLTRMMLAAPDLLEALELALISYNGLLLSDPPKDAWVFNGVEAKARAAIAKAKGR
jgi:hypothetical protein